MIRDFLEFCAVIGIAIVGMFCIIAGIGFTINHFSCTSYGEVTGRSVKTAFGACYVDANNTGVYLPREELEIRAYTNE